MIEKKSFLERFAKGVVRKQTKEIIIGKRKKYNFYRILFPARKIIEKKSDEIGFDYTLKYYFNQERNLYSSKFDRLKKNEKIKELQKKYPMVDILRLAKLLSIEGKISTRNRNDMEIFEYMIRGVLSLPLYERNKSLNEDIDSEASIIEYFKQEEKHKDILELIEQNKKEFEEN